MANYKLHMNSKFASCRLLAHARDNHRNRDVKLYAIPGEFDVVGVSDGVDVWIAPTSINPFSVNVKQLLEKLARGEDLTPAPLRRRFPAATEDSASTHTSTLRRRFTHV